MKNTLLQNGERGAEMKMVNSSDDKSIFAFTRSNDKATIFAIFNLSDETKTFTLYSENLTGEYKDFSAAKMSS